MPKIKIILLFSLFILTRVHAASFDCESARTKLEKLICANAALSELDTQLQQAYDNARFGAEAEEIGQLLAGQRRWLGQTRNRCTSEACLLKAYQDRLNELDPAADKHISCEEMRKYPTRVFRGSPDLGSGFSSMIDVDYQCAESLEHQVFMQVLLNHVSKIRSESTELARRQCSGSIVHAQWRYYHFDLLRAGFAPEFLWEAPAPVPSGQTWQAFMQANWSDKDRRVIEYFREWSEQSAFNATEYAEFAAEFDRAMPALISHYETRLALPRAKALSMAAGAMMKLLDRAAGSFPSDAFIGRTDLVTLARDGNATPTLIRQKLAALPDDHTDFAWWGVYRAVAVALINNRPLAEITAWAESLAPSMLQEKKDGEESLLSLAIGNRQNLTYLLGRGVPVDTENAFGKTPLYYAVGAGDEQAVALLLKAGANVNHTYKSAAELRPDGDECSFPDLNHTRRTPLMHTAQHANVAMLKQLLNAGAKLGAEDDLGYNARDYAVIGKKPDNEAYLKSLGLELGAPKYSSDPSPEVREQKIQTQLTIEGDISQLLVASGRPGILVAVVFPRRSNRSDPLGGLQVMSISDPLHPRLLGSQALPGIRTVLLSPDGMRAYVHHVADQTGTEVRHLLSVVDISTPAKPRILQTVAGNYGAVALSPDGMRLYVELNRHQLAEKDWALAVYRVGNRGIELECHSALDQDPVRTYADIEAIALFPDEPRMLINRYPGGSRLYEVRNPCAPVKLAEFPKAALQSLLFGQANRMLIAGGDSGILAFRVGDDLQRVTGYAVSADRYDVNAKLNAVTAMVKGEAALFRRPAKGRLILTDRFRTGAEFLGAVKLTDAGYIYMGWKGALGVGRVPLQ